MSMVLDFIFGFLLDYPPVVAVTIFAAIAVVLINIFYKILINQNEAKQVKQRVNELSKQMREEQKKGNIEKSNSMLKDVMVENSKMMKMTLKPKPMLASFIIVIFVLPWLHTHYGDITVQPVNGTGTINFEDVNYTFTVEGNSVSIDGDTTPMAFITLFVINNCETTCTTIIGKHPFEVFKEGDKIKFAPVVAISPVPIPLTGENVGWLMWYMIVSIPSVITSRKLMKIYM